MAGEIPDDLLLETCGETPGVVCEAVLDWTENETAAELAAWLVDAPLTILVIMVIAAITNAVARRLVVRAISEVTDEDAKRLLGALKRKTRADRILDSPTRGLRAEMRAQTIALVLKSVLSAVIWTIAVVMILSEIGINVGPLIAGAGIVGVALGFGAQSLVKDFLSGMFMLIEDQFGVGDVIDVGEATGVVEAVSLRVTRLRSVDGTVWHVPNGEIARVGNMSQQWARALVDIEVAYDTDLERAQQVIQEVADGVHHDDEWGRLLLEEPEVWGVETLGADGIAIRLVIKTVPGEQWGVIRELRRRLKDRFDAEGIEIPFPQRTMWIRRDEGSSRDDLEELDG